MSTEDTGKAMRSSTPSSFVSAQLLSQIADAIPNIVFIASAETGAVEHLSERFTQHTGMLAADALGDGWRTAVHAEDLARSQVEVENAIRTDEPFRTEARLRGRDGEYRWFDVRAAPLRKDGQVVRWFGTCTDIDDRRRAAAERARGAEVSLALTSTLVPAELVTSFARTSVVELADFCAVDLQDGAPFARRAAVALAVECGTLPPELARARPGALSSFNHATAASNALVAPLAADSVVVVPIVVGGARVGHVSFATLGRAPSFDHLDVVMLDSLVQRFATALAHARLLEDAQRASRLRDEFLAIVSHELRTPLSTILGWARLLREDSRDEARLRRGLEVIERSASTQSRIIDDLLDVSRAMSGKLRLDPQRVSVAAVATDAVEAMRPEMKAKGLAIEVDAAATAIARVDPERIRQVLWNLLSNAVKFTPAGGRISVHVRSDEDTVTIEVEDTGIGVEASFLPFVFDRFRQADSTSTRREGGLGLGLALVRAIVEQHGGGVQVESEGLGRGTKMTVALPVDRKGGPSARRATPIHVPRLGPTSDLLGVRILLVDDEPDARELSATILGLHGARVETAGSAAEAMDRLSQHDIELMVSDIGMPIEDGRSLVRRARAAQPSLKAIALSAYARKEDEERALEAGFARYLTKPVDPDLLVDTVLRVARPAR